MKKRITKLAAAGSSVLAFLSSATSVSAQTYDYYDDTTDSALSGMCCAGNMVVMVCGGIVSLALGAFNLWMLIDALQRDEKVLPGKVKWALLIFFIPFGSVAYFFMRKRPMDAGK